MDSDLHNRIRERLRALGLTPEGASKKAGFSRDYLTKLLARPESSPRSQYTIALAEALETTVSWLLTGRDPPSISNVRPADIVPPNMHDLLRDLPVFGTTAGSHRKGAVQISSDPIDYVRRPPALIGIKGAYSLFVEGDSMSPRFEHGELIFIRADRKARVGDDVVVLLKNGEHEDHESFIAKLLKLGSDQIVIGKLNPAAEITLDRTKVQAIHKVLTMGDLFGI